MKWGTENDCISGKHKCESSLSCQMNFTPLVFTALFWHPLTPKMAPLSSSSIMSEFKHVGHFCTNFPVLLYTLYLKSYTRLKTVLYLYFKRRIALSEYGCSKKFLVFYRSAYCRWCRFIQQGNKVQCLCSRHYTYILVWPWSWSSESKFSFHLPTLGICYLWSYQTNKGLCFAAFMLNWFYIA